MDASDLVALCGSPTLHAADDVIGDVEIGGILARAGDASWLAARGVTTRSDFTGFSCELPVAADPVIAAVAAKIYATVGMHNELGATLRFRRYAVGEHHPRHCDTYAVGARLLVATAMLCLTASEAGGETVFPAASPTPLALAPRVGRLLCWRNVLADGGDDAAASHASLPVVRGVKTTLTAFIYQGGWRAPR